jgi:hypothetical protein
MTDLDPDKIMAEHQPDDDRDCIVCRWTVDDETCADPWPCLPYRLAAENAALRAAKRDHDLANGGCVPKPAYDELAAEGAALRGKAADVWDEAVAWFALLGPLNDNQRIGMTVLLEAEEANPYRVALPEGER